MTTEIHAMLYLHKRLPPGLPLGTSRLPELKDPSIVMKPNPTFLEVHEQDLEFLLAKLPFKDLCMFATLKPTPSPKQAPKQKKRLCRHKKRPERCRECDGRAFCKSHGIRKEFCKECGGTSMCNHGRERRMCKECFVLGTGGTSLCPVHLVRKSSCKKCCMN